VPVNGGLSVGASALIQDALHGQPIRRAGGE
jgi:hypothetical protein